MKNEIIEVLDGEEGIAARIVRIRDGYSVVAWDTEEDKPITCIPIRIFPTVERARAFALESL